MKISFNGSNVVNFAVLLALFAAKTALSLGGSDDGGGGAETILNHGSSSPTLSTSVPPGHAPTAIINNNSTSTVTTTPSLFAVNDGEDDGGGDGGTPSHDALIIGLGVTLLVLAIIGLATFSLYRRFQNGGNGGRGWGRWLLRRGNRPTHNGTEIPAPARRPNRSPFHPIASGILHQSLPQRRDEVVMGIPLPSNSRPEAAAAAAAADYANMAIPTISVSLPSASDWGYANEYAMMGSSPTSYIPPTSPPPFELGGSYTLPVELPTPASSNNSSNCGYDVDAVNVEDVEDDEHEPCDPQTRYSSISTSTTIGGHLSPQDQSSEVRPPQLPQNYINTYKDGDVSMTPVGDGTPPVN